TKAIIATKNICIDIKYNTEMAASPIDHTMPPQTTELNTQAL
ncbi:30699_t:CDS:1, partial [Racocetra persica]